MIDRSGGDGLVGLLMAVSFKRNGVERSAHSLDPRFAFLCLWRNRQLFLQMVKRDVLSRYRGSFGGLIWSFLQPLLMLAVYTIALGYFLHATWPGTHNSLEYSVVLFSGLILFNFLAECIGRAPLIVLNNPNYVRKIIFPLEILAWVTVTAALFHTALSFVAWLVFDLLVRHAVHWTVIFVPLLLFPLALVAVGVCWLLGATGVFIRDISQLVVPLVQAMMFLSPLFYSVKDVPATFRKVLLINPLSFVIEQARAVMIAGQLPNFGGLAVYWLASAVFAWLGFCWFQHARDGFADVL
jgi:lipopolysaccharide transport system permease protein